MALTFNYQTNPSQVVFGPNGFSVVAEAVQALNCKRLIVLSTAGRKPLAEELAASLGESCVAIYSNATMHVPVDVTSEAMEEVRKVNADGIVAVGGGSTIGLSKAIAYRTNLPQIVIPTTYSGSEVTTILGQTEDGIRTTLRSKSVVPDWVIYDPALTHSLPAKTSITFLPRGLCKVCC